MITLIATVLNEGDNIGAWLASFQQQTRMPDEIIIVDGGSSDNTVAIMETYQDILPLRIIVEDGCNISEGRNIAMRAAQGDIIAVTDAGTQLTPNWLEDITQPLRENPKLGVSAGFFKAAPQTTFEAAMGATVLPLADEIDPTTFLPSSRSVAVRKSAALNVKGYPEWLDYCEDLIFDLRLQATTQAFAFVPDAFVYFRPRGNFRAFWTQYYLYARGDGKADLWRKRHVIRYITYLVALPLLLVLAFFVHPLWWSVLLLGGVIYTWRPYQRLRVVMQSAPDPSPLAWLQAIALVPMIRVVGDVAKMVGYPMGWRWRLQHHPPQWQLD